MGQLLKLSDYVSRYEIDIYRYPARYVRLKKERWQRLKQDWENRKKGYNDLPFWNDYEKKDSSIIKKSLRLFRSKKKDIKEEVDLPSEQQLRHHTMEELKEAFRKELFEFQVNWASSTVSKVSYVKKSYYFDTLLSFLLNELPDTYFVFYEPSFILKNAPVDLEVLVLTPSEVWLIHPLRGNNHTIFQPDSERFWVRKQDGRNERILHPFISLRRMKTVVEGILSEKGLSLPIRTAVVAKDSFIDMPAAGKNIKIIDKRNFDTFKQTILKNKSPIKHVQLKAADILLSQSLTTSEHRLSDGEQ
ncbi:hypothetical protein K8O68_03275 [Salipaludibacillus sp. CUR1]|uniref:hypothetical protein n=1 Tax=Salipaludibacillus sp. CUR1 TaxID=2820003 RepID=UPI001E3008DB|nr:hypothetical protein [Salipaludibacillus sp. CUR1]MCE7791444.1 hypothetical protein [Salipaludibacillus sp. CUR1]